MKASTETTFYEGGPARADLIINLLAAFTVVGLPFTFGAIVRALWLRFKITNRRIAIDGGWFGKNQSQITYSQIDQIRSVPRGFGSYGDMVLVLKDGSKIEMRSFHDFRNAEKYIMDQIDMRSSKTNQPDVQGFAA